MVKRILVMIALVLASSSSVVRAADVVRVGGYDFPPFVETGAGGAPSGLSVDLIAALNKAQSQYEFRFVTTSARRRYADVEAGQFDLMFFESPEWGWAARGAPVDFSNVFLKGGEVYIAPAKSGRGQEWFDDLKGKRLVGILGYHYGFAGFEADPDALARTWGMKLLNNHRSSIEMVLADRMDVAVVTDAYLWAYLSRNPAARERLLISDRYDQHYNHRVLVRRGGAIDVDTVNRLLSTLEQNGTLAALWKAAGVVR
ncbi:amino acid ABC transporter substrate-binding protein [Magnetospirillum aberrantis SpK]|uniref:Amino acid ABC transporter substrate-binding protein n=2 Tax=Magnetospirillum TaxID=13134 RepID=A0A7C9QU21_9PROT|nr:amino acid ABC transporter substrate-binding protein [Magnetospirillum aberrantis SpK]